MKICLVLHPENKGWIIEKFGRRMSENLQSMGHEVFFGQDVIPDVDITHFLSYNFVEKSVGFKTAFVTHIDDTFKVSHLKSLLNKKLVDKLICMSPSTVEHLVKHGLPRESLTYVLPAVDSLPPKRLIKIGLSGRIYKDKRKNIQWLEFVAERMLLDNFEFYFFGNGWEPISEKLKAAKAEVQIFNESGNYIDDHLMILEKLKSLDYWMYLGFDEGSMGSLDAALAGIPLIATPQGFHLDLSFNENFWVSSEMELHSILFEMSSKKPSNLESAYWNWLRYCEDHVIIWNGSDPARPKSSISGVDLAPELMLRKIGWRRTLSFLSRKPLGLKLRKKLRR